MKALSTRAKNCLKAENINSKAELVDYIGKSERGLGCLMRIPNIGKTSFNEIIYFYGLIDLRKQGNAIAIQDAIAFVESNGFIVSRPR